MMNNSVRVDHEDHRSVTEKKCLLFMWMTKYHCQWEEPSGSPAGIFGKFIITISLFLAGV